MKVRALYRWNRRRSRALNGKHFFSEADEMISSELFSCRSMMMFDANRILSETNLITQVYIDFKMNFCKACWGQRGRQEAKSSSLKFFSSSKQQITRKVHGRRVSDDSFGDFFSTKTCNNSNKMTRQK